VQNLLNLIEQASSSHVHRVASAIESKPRRFTLTTK